MVIQCEIWAEKPQFGFNDTSIPPVSAARQIFKQLDIRLTLAVSVVSGWFPAACNPWLGWWPLSNLARLSASLLVLQGEVCSLSALHRQMSTSPGIPEATELFLATLAAALASEHCRGSMQGCHQASWFSLSRHDTDTCIWRMLCQ